MVDGSSVFLAKDRQGNGERGAIPQLAVHLDVPAVVLDEAVTDRQA